MSETVMCLWCEHDTAEETDWIYQDNTMDEYDWANYGVYKCTHCGAEFRMGTATVYFNKFDKEGEPTKHVDYGLNE